MTKDEQTPQTPNQSKIQSNDNLIEKMKQCHFPIFWSGLPDQKTNMF